MIEVHAEVPLSGTRSQRKRFSATWSWAALVVSRHLQPAAECVGTV